MVQKNKAQKSTAVSYVYLASTEKNGDNPGLRYTKFIQEKADELGAKIVREFADNGTSADPDKRLALPEMFEYLSKNKVDYVIVPHFHMLSRHMKKLLKLADRMEKTGAKLISPSGEEEQMLTYQFTHAVNEAITNSVGTQEFTPCSACHERKALDRGCKVSTVYCNGRAFERVKAGDIRDLLPDMGQDEYCHDCLVGLGQYHHWGCDAEQCPFCDNQLIGCDCDIKMLLERNGESLQLASPSH